MALLFITHLFQLIGNDTIDPIEEFFINYSQIMVSVFLQLGLFKSEGNYLLNLLGFADLHFENIHNLKNAFLIIHQLVLPLPLGYAFRDVGVDTKFKKD